MCAIAGMIGIQPQDGTFEKMLETMHRRGPDGSGVYHTHEVALLHTRLAIIDPTGGAQPMILNWGGERYVLTYNGELYNTEELRKELLQLGHHFLGHSDTEVVLHAYAQWGDACVEQMNGIFAFGIWEEKRRRLFLARDRIGVKPLFYRLQTDGLIFASEIKTILACPGVKAELDEEGAAEILLLGPGRSPGVGVFRGIYEIEPGCKGYYEDGRLKIRRYWCLLDREHRDSFADTVDTVRYLITDAIRRQMVSDVPIGTFLSGGLDSSLISAVCAEEMKKRGESLNTFSVDYVGNDVYFQPNKFQPNSDPYYILQMEQSLSSTHHWTILTPEDLLSVMEAATIARDLPGMADVDFSLLLLCQEIRKGVKVALSGECADEIFGGYPWYRDPEIRDSEGFPWAQNIQRRKEMLAGTISIDAEDYVSSRYRDTCLKSDILPGTTPRERRMKEMMNLNFRWFMQTLLDRKDRMSMWSGLEVRVPFCDYRIAEYLYAVPWEFKDYQGKEKGLLRRAMEGWLPEEILWRKKSPYPKTFDPRYQDLVTSRLELLLDRGDSPLFYLVDRGAAKALVDQDSPWPWYGQLMKTPQTIAYLLQIDFWLRHYGIDFKF